MNRPLNRDYRVTVPMSERERQIALYAELAAESDRARRIHAALQTDALLVRVSQAARDDDRPAPSLLAWSAILAYVGPMTFATWEFATRVLPMIWRMS